MTNSFFADGEFICHCSNSDCDGGVMQSDFIEKLIKMRSTYYRKPLIVSSGYRCLAHDKAVGGTGKNHPFGFAADIIVNKGHDLMVFVQACFAVGIKRVIVYHDKFHVHVDDNPDLEPGLFVK